MRAIPRARRVSTKKLHAQLRVLAALRLARLTRGAEMQAVLIELRVGSV